MKRSLVAAAIAVSLVALSGALLVGAGASPATSRVAKVWTEPQAGYGFLDAAISDAKRTVDVSMYEFSDPTMENDLIADAQRGVLVQVLLNAAYEGKSDNAAAARKLKAGAVNVSWAPSSQIFHAKYVVIDNTVAYIGTGNFQSYYYASTRDFWVEDTVARDVAAISTTFGHDFSHQVVAPTSSGGLIWSPGSTGSLVGLIGSARHSLLVENEEMDDTAIERALDAAAERGVRVKVVMTYSSDWTSALKSLESSGVKVSTLTSSEVYIHAKVMCVDCTNTSGTVFIGSENFSDLVALVQSRTRRHHEVDTGGARGRRCSRCRLRDRCRSASWFRLRQCVFGHARRTDVVLGAVRAQQDQFPASEIGAVVVLARWRRAPLAASQGLRVGREFLMHTGVKDVERALPESLVGVLLAVAHDAAVELVHLFKTTPGHHRREHFTANAAGAVRHDGPTL